MEGARRAVAKVNGSVIDGSKVAACLSMKGAADRQQQQKAAQTAAAAAQRDGLCFYEPPTTNTHTSGTTTSYAASAATTAAPRPLDPAANPLDYLKAFAAAMKVHSPSGITANNVGIFHNKRLARQWGPYERRSFGKPLVEKHGEAAGLYVQIDNTTGKHNTNWIAALRQQPKQQQQQQQQQQGVQNAAHKQTLQVRTIGGMSAKAAAFSPNAKFTSNTINNKSTLNGNAGTFHSLSHPLYDSSVYDLSILPPVTREALIERTRGLSAEEVSRQIREIIETSGGRLGGLLKDQSTKAVPQEGGGGGATAASAAAAAAAAAAGGAAPLVIRVNEVYVALLGSQPPSSLPMIRKVAACENALGQAANGSMVDRINALCEALGM